MNKNKTLAISIDGTIRNFFEQFDIIYRKRFIKNPGLIEMKINSEHLSFEPIENNINEEDEFEKKINSLIHLPITTYDLRNHYEFENKDTFDNFINNNTVELYSSAPQFPFAMEKVNQLNFAKKELGLDNVILFCPGENQIITATLHFLTKNSCKIPNIIFSNNQLEIWDYADYVITDNPNILENKKSGQYSIKIIKEYNKDYESDLEINSLKELVPYNLEKLIKKIF